MLKFLKRVFGSRPEAPAPQTPPTAPAAPPPAATVGTAAAWREPARHSAPVGMEFSGGPHGFVGVVGESHYQEALRGLSDALEVLERHERNFDARLVPEPNNRYDANAIAVMAGDKKIGYLPREIAKSYHVPLARQPAPVECPAQLRGGEDGTKIGVVLDFKAVRLLKP